MRISEEPVESEIELTERKVKEAEESEEVIVPQYKISDPLLVEVLLDVTDILVDLSERRITISEARALIEERAYSKIRSMIEAKPEKKRQSRKRKSSSRAS